jgi:hypothetical protein
MIRSLRVFLGALAALSAISAFAQTCPTTGSACSAVMNPGNDFTAAAEARTAGQTLCLNPGTYSASANGGFGAGVAFMIGKSITVCGLGATPGATVLRGGASNDYAVKFVQYIGGNSPNNATLTNLQINTNADSNGGVLLQDFIGNTTLSGITLRDLVVLTKTTGTGFGILLNKTDKINVSNVSVSSNQTSIYVFNSNRALIANSTVTNAGAEGANGLAVIGGTGHVVVGNTIGSPKVGPNYSFNSGAVVFYNTPASRFDMNTVQGFRDDGVDFTATDNFAGQGVPAAASDRRLPGQEHGHRDRRRGRAQQRLGHVDQLQHQQRLDLRKRLLGVPECGLCVWMSKSNMVLGNVLARQQHRRPPGLGRQRGGQLLRAGGGAFQSSRPTPSSTELRVLQQERPAARPQLGQHDCREQLLVGAQRLRRPDALERRQRLRPGGRGHGCPRARRTPASASSRIPATTTSARSRATTASRPASSTPITATSSSTAPARRTTASSRARPRTGTAASHGGNFWTLFLSPNGNPATIPTAPRATATRTSASSTA